MTEQQHSPLPWGASNTRAMVVSPPPEVIVRQFEEGKFPIEFLRIANCDNQNYISPAVARANAEFIAKACNSYYQTQALNAKLLAACEAAFAIADDYGDSGFNASMVNAECHELAVTLRPVIEEAKKQ